MSKSIIFNLMISISLVVFNLLSVNLGYCWVVVVLIIQYLATFVLMKLKGANSVFRYSLPIAISYTILIVLGILVSEIRNFNNISTLVCLYVVLIILHRN